MNLTRTSRFDAPHDRVVEVLCSEAFQLSLERKREGVSGTEYVVVERSDARLVFELRSREYKRTMTGGFDRSGTVSSTTRNTYDAAARTLRWTYSSANSERIVLEGTYRFAPDGGGGGTRVVHDITIEARIPLVGGRIAKYIAGEMERSLDDQDRDLARALA